MMLAEAKANPVDFSSLALDAAIQLDRLQKHKGADLSVINSFAKYLEAPSGGSGTAGLFCLHENPVNVDILNSAIYGVDGHRLVSIDDLEAKARELIVRVNDVASGRNTDERTISSLKRFCLSLHRILLEKLAPTSENDEWMPARDKRLT
jgi:hypothetical protein